MIVYNLQVTKTTCTNAYARVAEQADAQDLKSCGLITRTGSIPVSRTIKYFGFEDCHCRSAFFLSIKSEFAKKKNVTKM